MPFTDLDEVLAEQLGYGTDWLETQNDVDFHLRQKAAQAARLRLPWRQKIPRTSKRSLATHAGRAIGTWTKQHGHWVRL